MKLNTEFHFFIKLILIIRYYCPTGWHLSNQLCYLKVEQGYDWNSAKDYCQAQDPTSFLVDTNDFDYLKTVNWGSMWVKLIFIYLKKK